MYNTIDEIVTKLNDIYCEACDLHNLYCKLMINKKTTSDFYKIFHIMFDNRERRLSDDVIDCFNALESICNRKHKPLDSYVMKLCFVTLSTIQTAAYVKNELCYLTLKEFEQKDFKNSTGEFKFFFAT